MKQLILISAVLMLTVAGCSDDRFNFTYTGGDQPWLDLNPSEIHATPDAEAYAQIWKRAFQTRNGMTDEYFDAHIAVINSHVKEKTVGPKRMRQFWISYYFHVDWALIHRKDDFVISLDGACDSTMLEDVMAFVEDDNIHLICGATASISWIEPVEHIATKGQIRRALKKASPLLRLNVNNMTRLGRGGQLECDLHGVVDYKANMCLRAKLRLVDATVSDITQTVCWMK